MNDLVFLPSCAPGFERILPKLGTCSGALTLRVEGMRCDVVRQGMGILRLLPALEPQAGSC